MCTPPGVHRQFQGEWEVINVYKESKTNRNFQSQKGCGSDLEILPDGVNMVPKAPQQNNQIYCLNVYCILCSFYNRTMFLKDD